MEQHVSETDLVEQFGFKPDEAKEAARLVQIPIAQRTADEAALIDGFTQRIMSITFDALEAVDKK